MMLTRNRHVALLFLLPVIAAPASCGPGPSRPGQTRPSAPERRVTSRSTNPSRGAARPAARPSQAARPAARPSQTRHAPSPTPRRTVARRWKRPAPLPARPTKAERGRRIRVLAAAYEKLLPKLPPKERFKEVTRLCNQASKYLSLPTRVRLARLAMGLLDKLGVHFASSPVESAAKCLDLPPKPLGKLLERLLRHAEKKRAVSPLPLLSLHLRYRASTVPGPVARRIYRRLRKLYRGARGQTNDFLRTGLVRMMIYLAPALPPRAALRAMKWTGRQIRPKNVQRPDSIRRDWLHMWGRVAARHPRLRGRVLQVLTAESKTVPRGSKFGVHLALMAVASIKTSQAFEDALRVAMKLKGAQAYDSQTKLAASYGVWALTSGKKGVWKRVERSLKGMKPAYQADALLKIAKVLIPSRKVALAVVLARISRIIPSLSARGRRFLLQRLTLYLRGAGLPASVRGVLKKLETQARTLSPWSHARVLSNLGRAEARSAAGASEVARRLRQGAGAAAKLPPKKRFLVVADLALLAVERRRAAWAGLAKDLQSLAPRADPSHVSWLVYKLVDSKWPAARRLAATLLKSLVSRAAKWPHSKAFALGRLVAELAPDLLPPHRALALVNRLGGLQKMLAQVDSRQRLHYHFGVARLRLGKPPLPSARRLVKLVDDTRNSRDNHRAAIFATILLGHRPSAARQGSMRHLLKWASNPTYRQARMTSLIQGAVIAPPGAYRSSLGKWAKRFKPTTSSFIVTIPHLFHQPTKVLLRHAGSLALPAHRIWFLAQALAKLQRTGPDYRRRMPWALLR